VIIPLSKGKETVVIGKDAILGKKSWYFRGGYAVRSTQAEDEYMHRTVAERMGLDIFGLEVDHKNGNKLDNRRGNLRVATHEENGSNRTATRAVTGYKGVTILGKRFVAQIKHKGHTFRLGSYGTAEQAAAAYDHAARDLFGEFACLNGVKTKFVDMRGKRCTNTSGYRGVSWHKKAKKWAVSLRANKKTIHVGSFADKEEAARAYNDAAIKYLGPNAYQNQIGS
jgi:hypothetical protein